MHRDKRGRSRTSLGETPYKMPSGQEATQLLGVQPQGDTAPSAAKPAMSAAPSSKVTADGEGTKAS